MLASLVAFFQRAVVQGIPLLLGSTGEILTEKSGNLNLGIPGIMYVGAISGVIGSFKYENAMLGKDLNPFLAIFIPIICSIVGSGLMGLLYCALTVIRRCNQNVVGLAMTTFGVGFGNFFGSSLIRLSNSDMPSIALIKTSAFFTKHLPFAENLGVFGQLFLNYGFLTYAAIIIAVVCAIVLRRTRVGLNLRAVGENPGAADAAGIDVTKYKIVSTVLGSVIAGLGGLFYIFDYTNGVWSNDGFGDRGWLAIALVIFALWKPDLSIFGSILFGGLYIVYLFVPGLSLKTQELFKMLPYVVTIIVLIITSITTKKESSGPQSLGVPYFREER